ncbi:MAG: nucleotidyl transferase AbiEii/AbiGii toxin family protein [Anaerolineae bacterium]|jgi:predicted nucleotidyltransferase component of viral defense system|nr:nucleotidyl transferase AbiEii/AbiGii toxin family protein [Anaerolineae bacterium]
MKPLRNRINRESRKSGIAQYIVEKDYALSYLLFGFSTQEALAENLILKGGTALRKLYFGDYRFSEDLDYSTLAVQTGQQLEDALRGALEASMAGIRTHGPFEMSMERLVLREPHPRGQDAFKIRVRFPWHPDPRCIVKVEVTQDEPILLPPETRTLLHGYEEELDVNVRCYCLEEVLIEKMRALLQSRERLNRRGWEPRVARDYYDIWRILSDFGNDSNLDGIIDLLENKCSHRGVAFESLDDFLAEELVAEARRSWPAVIGKFVREPPESDKVIEDLERLLPEMLEA